MNVEEMNDDINMFCLFILFQLFTAKQYKYVQYIRGFRRPKYTINEKTGEKIEVPWRIIHNIRRRPSNRDYKTKGVIPKNIKNEDGTYTLFSFSSSFTSLRTTPKKPRISSSFQSLNGF